MVGGPTKIEDVSSYIETLALAGLLCNNIDLNLTT